MPRRGENIRKRKDGRWEARYTKQDGNGLSGKYGSVYGRTYQEAKNKRTQILKAGMQKEQTQVYLFKDILELWQHANRVRLKEASVSRYQNLIDTHILPELGNKRMDQMNAATINHFLADKLKKGRMDGIGGLSPSYVRSIALVISSAINYGATENLCTPLSTQIKKPVLPKKELCIIRAEEQLVLEQTLLTDMNAEKLLIYITLYTGLRIGEACALRWEDIDLAAKLIYVRQTVSRVWQTENGKKSSKLVVGLPKTEASLRCIPICSKLYGVLIAFPRQNRQGFVLTSQNSNSFTSPRTFEYRYKQILRAAKLELVNYHVLRHTFATRCIECGVDIKSLSEVLGHANVSITLNTYVHSSMDLKRTQLEKLVS